MSENMMVRRVSALPASSELQEAWKIAKEMIGTGFLPKAIDTPQKAIAIYLKGSELGIPFMASMAGINIIEGKPTMSANAMMGVCYRDVPGFAAEFTKLADGYRGVFYRNGTVRADLSFTRADAERAGLLGKGPWQKYFDAMCIARVQTMGCRIVGADALMGIAYTPEELGAEVDEDGSVVAGPAPVLPPAPVPGPAPVSEAEVVEGEPQAAAATSPAHKEVVRSTDGMAMEAAPPTVDQLMDTFEDPRPREVEDPLTTFQEEWALFMAQVVKARKTLKPKTKDALEPRLVTEYPEGLGKFYLNHVALARHCGHSVKSPTLLMVGGEPADNVDKNVIRSLRMGLIEMCREAEKPNYAKGVNS